MIAPWFASIRALVDLPPWLPQWVLALVVPVSLFVLYALGSRLILLFVPRSRRYGIALVVRRTRPAVGLLLMALSLAQTLPPYLIDGEARELFSRINPLVITVLVTILAYRLIGTVFVHLRKRFDISTPDNLKARRATTQIIVLERVVGFVVILVGIAAGLTTIPGVRQYGASLLASAGVAGLVIGFAAQQTIANVIAGIQIAITQPLRIEDAVVIDGEWGWVEEITLTYIVVRIWDRRRQVVPISYLLNHPFQNWTRTQASIIGSVYLHVDFTLDVDRLRAEQTRLLAAEERWDGEVDVIQVVDTTERTMVLRSLVSAASSQAAWDLRCAVREGLIAWIRARYPDSLPRERLRVKGTIQA